MMHDDKNMSHFQGQPGLRRWETLEHRQEEAGEKERQENREAGPSSRQIKCGNPASRSALKQ
jgi:hypothetical protein